MQINQKISDRQFFIKHEKSHAGPILAPFDLKTSKQYSSQKNYYGQFLVFMLV